MKTIIFNWHFSKKVDEILEIYGYSHECEIQEHMIFEIAELLYNNNLNVMVLRHDKSITLAVTDHGNFKMR